MLHNPSPDGTPEAWQEPGETSKVLHTLPNLWHHLAHTNSCALELQTEPELVRGCNLILKGAQATDSFHALFPEGR